VRYLLDTHVWIWWHLKPTHLSRRARSLLANPDRYSELLLSAISPWEFSELLEKQRLGISCSPEEWLARALQMAKLRLAPITPTIAYRSTILPQPFHSDPADQIIVATAREENATIISSDAVIRNYPHVRSLW
jgi:PIN domain nuclease of toxin-antitoxin system